MSLKKLFLFLFGFQLLLVAGTGVLTVLLFVNQGNLNNARETEFQSYLLADELRQSSDDLTRLARVYVATGDAKYEQQYLDILDIRNGKKPRPVEYNRIYWDFVAASGTKPRADGETIALQDLMKKVGFTEAEFAKLTEAQKNSDGLVKAETIAMNAVKGLFEDASGNFTVKKAPDREMALKLVFDDTYHKNKANIMKPIDDFYVLFQARTAKEVQVYQDLSSTYIIAIIILILLTMLMFGVSFVIIQRQVTNPLQYVAEVANVIATQDLKEFSSKIDEIANGDLTRTVSLQARKIDVHSENEVGQMAKALEGIIAGLQSVGASFQQMTDNFRNSLLEMKDNAVRLNASSVSLSEAATQASQATGQISTTIQQVAKGTTDQAQSVNRTASSVEKMSKVINRVAEGAQEQSQAISRASDVTNRINVAIRQVAGNAESVTRDSASAADAAHRGAKTVEETLAGMQSIKSKVGVSAQKVQEMGKRSEQIGAIVETIDDIASQTNLLALNAAIEAARAGEHGKGFAVVAEEVRKLAERASSATKEIGGLISSIQKTVTEAVKAMEEGSKEVELGVQSASQAGSALSDILDAAEAVKKQALQASEASEMMNKSAGELVKAVDTVSAVVEENTAATRAMAVDSNEVSQAIESIASVSEENSAAIQQVSASTEEMSAQVDEVTSSAHTLMDMAKTLQEIVAQFKLEEEAVVSRAAANSRTASRARR